MLRLKTILHSKYLYISFIIVIFFLFIISINKKSIYNIDDNSFTCLIDSYYIDESKIDIRLSCDEVLLGSIYYKDISEVDSFKETYNYKDKVRVYGSLKEISKPTNMNEFDYNNYYKIRGIFYRVNITKIEKIESYSFIYSVYNFFKYRIDNLKSNNIINSLVFGNKKYIEDYRLDIYKELGIMHLFSVSGMHISIIVELLNKLSKKERRLKNITILLILFIYYLVVNTVSILRAFISYLITLLNNKYNLGINKYLKVLIIVIIMLLINPLYILDSSFYLSVVTGSILILYSDHLKDNNVFKSIFKLSIICSIITFPLISYIYNEVNILSFINTFISSIIITYIIFPLSIITIIIPLFDNLLFICMNLFNGLIDILKSFNISLIFRKNLLFVFIYYLILFLSFKNKKFLILFFIMVFIHYNYNYIFINNYVYFFDIGQGDSSLISINNRYYLIDTGGNPKSDYNLAKNKIIPVLKSLGIRKLDALILTHGDYDHMGEAINLIDDFKIDKVIFNCYSYNEIEEELIKVLDSKNINYNNCLNNIDKRLYFLNTKEYDNENDNSNVLYLNVNNKKFLFMGDAGIDKEKDILKKYNLSNIDILKVGHHGSKTSSSKEFIDSVDPKYSIISVGKNNRYGHPNKEVLDNLNNSSIYRTDQDGGIMIGINNSIIKTYAS